MHFNWENNLIFRTNSHIMETVGIIISRNSLKMRSTMMLSTISHLSDLSMNIFTCVAIGKSRSMSRSTPSVRPSFRPSETIRCGRFSEFISFPINLKFIQKLYNHKTLNEFENQVSVWIIFEQNRVFKLKSQILRIVNVGALAYSFLFGSIWN